MYEILLGINFSESDKTEIWFGLKKIIILWSAINKNYYEVIAGYDTFVFILWLISKVESGVSILLSGYFYYIIV